ncbi:helix-turn-helix domain-containing protein [Actinoplanes sp. NPDC024001]|uniref:helix-turn-helix domain-containing protein n=1 Tax=Actinoplanes sp. NPDC024001 TaxID=3154598 RepID=UPI0033F064AA
MTKRLTVVPDQDTTPEGPEELWSIEETAAYLRVPPGTLYQWRHRRKGPPAFKVGKHLRYDPTAVRAWVMGQVA